MFLWAALLEKFCSVAGPLTRPNCYKTQSILQGKVPPCQKLWQAECQLQCVQSCPAVWQTGLSWECWQVETLVSPSLARPCTLADLLFKKCCAADKADLLGSGLKSLAVLEHAGLQFCNLAIQFCSSLQSSLAACGKPFLVRVLKLGRLAGAVLQPCPAVWQTRLNCGWCWCWASNLFSLAKPFLAVLELWRAELQFCLQC